MATDKRFAYNQAPNKDYGASITINLPTTSANQSGGQSAADQDNNNNSINNNSINDFSSRTNDNNDIIHSYSIINRQSRNNYIGINQSNDSHNINNSAVSVTRNGSSLNHCHHEAATRSLLFNNHHNNSSSSFLTPTTSTDDTSDDSPTPPPYYHQIPGIVPSYQGRTSGPPPSYDEVVNPNAPPPSYQSLFGQVREARKTSNGLVDLFRQLFLILIGTLGCTMVIGFLLLIPITMILVGIVYVNECKAENIPSFLVIGGLVWIVKNVLNCYNQFKRDSTTSNRPPPRRTPISHSSATTRNLHNPLPPTTTSPSSITITTSATTQSHTNAQQLPVTIAATGGQNETSSAATRTRAISSNSTATMTTSTTAPMTTTTATTTTSTTTTRDLSQQQANVNRIRNPSLIGITSFKCESMLNYFLIVWFLAGCIVVYRIYEPDYDNPTSMSYCNRTVYLYAFWLMTSTFIIMAIVLSCLCCLMASSLMSCNHGR